MDVQDGKAAVAAVAKWKTMTPEQQAAAPAPVGTYCNVTGLIGTQLQIEMRLPYQWSRRYVHIGGGNEDGVFPSLDSNTSGAVTALPRLLVALARPLTRPRSIRPRMAGAFARSASNWPPATRSRSSAAIAGASAMIGLLGNPRCEPITRPSRWIRQWGMP
jgi:hypothetical protein